MSALTLEHRLCAMRAPAKPSAGLDALADRLGGAWRRRRALPVLREDAQKVEALGAEIARLSNDALRIRLADAAGHFRRARTADAPRQIAALALVREAAERQLGMRPFFVQIIGALALRSGALAEMATGEGKSLTAALAATLAGWSGRPCHVVTVNDYLACRDAEKFQPLYEFCGLDVGALAGAMPPSERALSHAAAVTYTTSKELLADFLRDRLCLGGAGASATRWSIRQLRDATDATRGGTVLRGLDTAIVDEADSVLIDEAVTPLIIAGSEGPAGPAGSAAAFSDAWKFAVSLTSGVDYRPSESFREVELLPAGRRKIAEFGARLPALWRGVARKLELVSQALVAREFFHAEQQYVVQDGEIVIVDDFTGRLMPLRKWRHGLHQAIEAKEGVAISPLDETLARMSFQRFFRLFRHLSGMTGTGREGAAEFWKTYRLPVVAIPTNRPCRRRDLPDLIFAKAEAKWAAVADEVARLHPTGRPILIGTGSIAASEGLAARLTKRGFAPAVLNATRHLEEARIIAEAGTRGRITIATNMAGRGTDIELGEGVAALGGLHVLATERHESGRIDRQLYGRAGRQGDPGSAQALVSAEDELLRRHAGGAVQRCLRMVVSGHVPGHHQLAALVFARAQRAAQRRAVRQREQVLAQDDWLEEALSFTASQT